jgi:hypothetical protein
LNIIAKLGDGGKGVDRELSHSLQPAINELAQDRQWRVRVAVIELMPSLAERLGEGFFTDELRKLCLASVRDRVFAVRRESLLSETEAQREREGEGETAHSARLDADVTVTPLDGATLTAPPLPSPSLPQARR